MQHSLANCSPEQSSLALQGTGCSGELGAAWPRPLGWLAARARLINRDSSAPLLIMQELSVSGGVPQQKLHCFCISDTASAGVMGCHADKAFWLFVILRRHLGAERWPSQEVHPEQRRAQPLLCLSGTLPCFSIRRDQYDC